MRVAIVHDWLNTKFGGAERVLIELAAMYPEAPIYTLVYNHEIFGQVIPAERVITSKLQKYPSFIKRRSRYLLPFIPTAIEQFDLSSYDVVISSSAAYGKGVITKPETLHICYCHTPMRFVWDYWPRYIDEQRVGLLSRAAIHLLTSRIRLWDFYSSKRVDKWIANSETTSGRIRKYYRQEPDAIIYPGADTAAFKPSAAKKPYFVTLAALTPYKKIDLAIQACNRLGVELKVMSDGPDRHRLEQLAGPTVSFTGRVSDEERAGLLAEAQALIYPNEEDFGIVPVEAMASGTPVIAFGRGGLTETVVPNETGVLFDDQTVEGLTRAIEHFQKLKFDPDKLVARAEKFSNTKFRSEIRRFAQEAYDAR